MSKHNKYQICHKNQAKDYLNVYFETVNFIDNGGNRENRKIFEGKMKKKIIIPIQI